MNPYDESTRKARYAYWAETLILLFLGAFCVGIIIIKLVIPVL